MKKQNKEMTLREFCSIYDQKKASSYLKVTQGAISRAIADKREIHVTVTKSGVINNAYEIKPFGRFKK